MRTTAFLALLALLTAAVPVGAGQAPSPPTAEEIAKYAKAKATITTRLGTMVVEFYPDKAPLHVKNFITLAESGFYNGTSFHRVIPGFMIQGGDPAGNGTGGPGYTIPAEFNSTKHVPGILSMARSRNPNSAGSQFFIMVGASPQLDNQYTVFGKVVEGQETADKIVRVPRNRSDKPTEAVTMEVKISY
jgi:peptidyl-prolyl cis-trans isomerase B (cyclophilin B)